MGDSMVGVMATSLTLPLFNASLRDIRPGDVGWVELAPSDTRSMGPNPQDHHMKPGVQPPVEAGATEETHCSVRPGGRNRIPKRAHEQPREDDASVAWFRQQAPSNALTSTRQNDFAELPLRLRSPPPYNATTRSAETGWRRPDALACGLSPGHFRGEAEGRRWRHHRTMAPHSWAKLQSPGTLQGPSWHASSAGLW